MIVSELIAQLQKLPQDAKVIIVNFEDMCRAKWDQEVRDVIYNPPSCKSDPHTVELDNWPATDYLGDFRTLSK